MKRILFFTVCCLAITFISLADIPQVPSQMEFAGMKLKITDAARAEMQKHVNSLRASDKYFKIKLDRVNLYFPIIERVFQEENLPDDFKYLVIQESALIGDAVSSANAVGFWQFKDFTGREVGLRIDKQVDERMNIVSATRGAAKYMKTNNFYYNNWVYALLAYNTGRGGARKYVKEELYGVAKMTIDKKTHWYVKTFLAHKIAFENEIGGQHREGLILQEYTKGAGENLPGIADRFQIERELLAFYNKWLKKGTIPTDKVYPVLLPVKGKIPDRKLVAKKNNNGKEAEQEQPSVRVNTSVKRKYARYLKEGLENASVVYVKTNGIEGLLAVNGDDVASLARKSGLSEGKFMKYNDLEADDTIRPGSVYYLRKKKNKSAIKFHILKPDETLWQVSQMYGIKLSRLRKYNRLKEKEPKDGRVLWLGKKIPKDLQPAYKEVKPEYIPGKIESEAVVSVEKPADKEKVIIKNEPAEDNTNVTAGNEEQSEEKRKPVKVKIDPIIEKTDLPEDSAEDSTSAAALIIEEKQEKEVAEKIEEGAFDLHEVEPGQTLFSIAQQYGVSINDLIEWNNLDPYNTTLLIGQKLQLKKPFQTPDEAEEIPTEKVLYHVVQPKETAFAISRKYDITIAQLIFWNSLSEDANIAIGQRLKVSGAFTDQKEGRSNLQDAGSDADEADASYFHEVMPGETLYSLSRKYDITVKELIRINNKKDAAINIGEKIRIKE